MSNNTPSTNGDSDGGATPVDESVKVGVVPKQSPPPSVSNNQDEEEDEFKDATTENAVTFDDKAGMDAVNHALELMLNNDYAKAEAILKPWADVSPYHSTGYGTILFMRAMMSFEFIALTKFRICRWFVVGRSNARDHVISTLVILASKLEAIELATTVLQDAVALLNNIRKKQNVIESLSGMVFGQKMDLYTPAELHSEIFYAECNMLLSLLTFFQDESLVSFIKGGLRIRQCYNMYKSFHQWLKSCTDQGIEVDEEFVVGVQLGIGCFNLIISLLPPRVLKLLEFVGFSGNKQLGLQQLNLGAKSSALHSTMCSSFLLFYYTVASVILGLPDSDADQCDVLVSAQQERFPNCLVFMYFKGRVELMRGDVNKAIVWFNKAIDAQDQWSTVHHLCWWELQWCYCFKGQWGEAVKYADKLFKASKWSKATFLYQKVAFMLMLRHKDYLPQQEDATITVPAKDELNEMLKAVPPFKQRIAGKSIPVEKFVIAKSERALEGARLPLCGLEMIYAWNGFQLLCKNQSFLESAIRVVWDELMTVEETQSTNPNYVDDWAVVTLIQGACFKGLKRYDEATQCFQAIIDRSQELQHDHYAAPAAQMELGLLYLEIGKLDVAERTLEASKNNFKGYHLESRIHFRIHAGMCRINQLKSSSKT